MQNSSLPHPKPGKLKPWSESSPSRTLKAWSDFLLFLELQSLVWSEYSLEHGLCFALLIGKKRATDRRMSLDSRITGSHLALRGLVHCLFGKTLAMLSMEPCGHFSVNVLPQVSTFRSRLANQGRSFAHRFMKGYFCEFGCFPWKTKEQVIKSVHFVNLGSFVYSSCFFPGKTLRILKNAPFSRSDSRFGLSLVVVCRSDS